MRWHFKLTCRVILIVLVVLILIVAHGCHSGDHDLEPVFFPFRQQEP
ncbi:MAG: hypothetical protein ACRC8S_05850 [Fimbriiglobus sp.]